MSLEEIKNKSIFKAEIDRKVITYLWVLAISTMIMGIFTIPLILIWIPFGRAFHKAQYVRMSLELTERTLIIKRGYIFPTDQTISLEKITDVTLSEGPLTSSLGIVRLSIETAGNNPVGMIGIIDAGDVRSKILKQRDILAASVVTPGTQQVAAIAGQTSQSEDMLVEIRDILLQINSNLSSEESKQ